MNVDGVLTSLFSETYSGSASTALDGKTLEFDVVGTSLQLFLNGSIVAYANNSTFATGGVGMLTSGGPVVVSNFNAVAITPPTASYPFAITAAGTSPITGLSNGQLNSYWSIQSGDYVDNAGTLTGQSSGVNLATVNGVSETTENVSATITLTNWTVRRSGDSLCRVGCSEHVLRRNRGGFGHLYGLHLQHRQWRLDAIGFSNLQRVGDRRRSGVCSQRHVAA